MGTIERRRLGRTDMQVSVLGFGGAEIGYEKIDHATVGRLLGSALDAGLNVVDTAECYIDSEVQIGTAIGHRRKEFLPLHQVRPRRAAGAGRTGARPRSSRSIERSLRRLKTDASTSCSSTPARSTSSRRASASKRSSRRRSAGKTRYIGYSGDARPRATPSSAGASTRCRPRSTSPTRSASS